MQKSIKYQIGRPSLCHLRFILKLCLWLSCTHLNIAVGLPTRASIGLLPRIIEWLGYFMVVQSNFRKPSPESTNIQQNDQIFNNFSKLEHQMKIIKTNTRLTNFRVFCHINNMHFQFPYLKLDRRGKELYLLMKGCENRELIGLFLPLMVKFRMD